MHRHRLARLGQIQRPQHQHGGDTSADRGFGHGDVHRIQHEEHACHQEAVDAAKNHDAEQIAHPRYADGNDGHQGQKHHVDEGFHYRTLPFALTRLLRDALDRAGRFAAARRLAVLPEVEDLRADLAGLRAGLADFRAILAGLLAGRFTVATEDSRGLTLACMAAWASA